VVFVNRKSGNTMAATNYFLLVLVTCCLSIHGCGEDPTSPQYSSEMNDFWLTANCCDSPVSKLVMEFTDPVNRVVFTFDSGCFISTSIRIPTGPEISILVQGYNPDDAEVSRSEMTISIDPDVNSTITIPLESLIGSRTLEVILYNVFSKSTFTTDTEGWTSWNNGQTDVAWVGGNEGCLSLTDASDGSMAFRAPAELRDGADLSSCYGAQLKFRMKVSGNGTWLEQHNSWNVMIVSDTHGTLTMSFPEALLVDFPYRWQHIFLNLSTTPSVIRSRDCYWQMDDNPASEEEITNVLSDVSNLLISAEFYDGNETVYLDDVVITSLLEPVRRDRRKCNGLEYMSEMPFDQVVFPGNHNAGAHNLKWCSGGGDVPDCSWQNHGVTPTTQINFGIRYFDFDMCGCTVSLVTCHGKDGARAWKFNTIFTKFDDFLNLPDNRNEVIVITIADINGNHTALQNTLSEVIGRFWHKSSTNPDSGELSIFTKSPGDPWPTLGYLVDCNSRIIFFVRDVKPVLEEIGILSERDYIYDTYKWRWINVYSGGCDFYYNSQGTNPRKVTYDRCALADPGKLVAISVFGAEGLCIKEMAGCFNPWIDDCIYACMEARAYATGKPLLEVTPNFILADYTYSKGNMIGPVRDINLWILQENGFPVNNSFSQAEGMTSLDEINTSGMYRDFIMQYYSR